MIPVPDVTGADAAFGSIKHMPKYENVPEEFKGFNLKSRWVKLVTQWFFKGLSKEEVDALKPKPGVDKWKALAAVKAIVVSFEPKHEHKEAGCAYLMSEWFE